MTAPAARPLERYTLDGTLAAVERHVSAALVPASAWAAVTRAARALPAALTGAVYLECRLGQDAPVDLIVRVEREGAALLAGHNPRARLSPALRDDPAWRAVAELCGRWVMGNDAVSRCVSHLWLEFDLEPGAARPIPRPSLFAGLRDDAAAGMSRDDAAALLAWLGGAQGAMDPGTQRAAAALMARRGPGLRVPYVGVMASRAVPAVRVYYRGPGAARVTASLSAAGWPGPAPPLDEAVCALSAVRGAPGIGMAHVDVAGEPLPRAGIEFALAREPQVRGRLAETAFLDRLVEMGLCTPERRYGLAAWPGARFCALPHELWESVMVRRVNCVKLVSGTGGLEAKGYLLSFTVPAPTRGTTRPRDPAGAPRRHAAG